LAFGDRPESGAFHGLAGWALLTVLECGAGHLEAVLLCGQLGQLVMVHVPSGLPFACNETPDLSQREPELTEEADQADVPDCRGGITPSSRHPSRRPHQPKFVVVPQRGRGHAGTDGPFNAALAVNTVGMWPDPTGRQVGHWEGDVVVGKDHLSAIGTLVERQTRMVRLLHLPQRDADTLHTALKARMADLPPSLLRSITWDQGTEMARHLTITESLGAPVYFCDSRSPWQRGSNENANGLLRDYFPKGTDLGSHSPQHLLAVENELNTRPRLTLKDRSPAELFTALLASDSPSVLRR
jgi:hypothetical protein